MKRIRAVLFDAAGTLIRPREEIGETYARFAAEFGVRLPASRLGEAFGRVLRSAEPMVLPGADPETSEAFEREWWRQRVRSTFRAADSTVRFHDFNAFFDAIFRHFATAEAWCAMPGAGDVLRALRARDLATGVISNFDHRLPALLEGLGLADLLDTVVRPFDAGAAKPDPRIFRVALERLGVPAEAAVYVGDDAEVDAVGARGAGLHAIVLDETSSLADLPARIDGMGDGGP